MSKLPRDVRQLPRHQPRVKITQQEVTGSGRGCPTCPRQDSTCYNYESYLPASGGEVRTARASVQSRRTSAGLRDCQCGHFGAKCDGGLDGRVQFFELCFDRAELDVVAVQESREKGDSHRLGLMYDRFCASADAMGCFGTEIWVRRSSCVVLGNSEAVSPQLTVARVRFHGVSLSVISAHAPHGFRSSKVIRSGCW